LHIERASYFRHKENLKNRQSKSEYKIRYSPESQVARKGWLGFYISEEELLI